MLEFSLNPFPHKRNSQPKGNGSSEDIESDIPRTENVSHYHVISEMEQKA